MATSVDSMTSDQLREHLYHNLQGRGVLDTIKSQLRQRLAKELHKSVPFGARKSPKLKKTPTSSEAEKSAVGDYITSGVVVDYLKKRGYEYTLSVFLPEAGVSADKVCSMKDLVHHLRIPTSSSLHDKLLTCEGDHSLLEQLFNALIDSNDDQTVSSRRRVRFGSPEQHTSPSQSPKEAKRVSVAEQLQALDQSYAQKAEEQRIRTQQNLEERLLAFQHDLETQHKTQLETELSLYKSRELAKMRLEERERYEKELANERLQSTVAHQKKVDELRKTEQQVLERYRKKEQDLEAGTHAQRQTLLAELNSLKVREAEMKRRADLNQRATSLEEERLNKLLQQLEGKERALERTKAHYESMAEEKAQKFKLELESQLQARQNELSRWETELKGDRNKMASIQTQLTKLTAELLSEREKADRLQGLLHEAMARQITLQGEKDSLQKRVEQVGDCDQLKEKSQELAKELASTERKLQDYKRRHSDSQRIIRDSQSKVPRPTQELEAIKKEVDEIRKAHHKEVAVLERDNRELKRQLITQTEYAGRLQRKLDEQLVQLTCAQREVRDIHSFLEQQREGGARRSGLMVNRSIASNKKTPAVSMSALQPQSSHLEHPPSTNTTQPHTSQPPQVTHTLPPTAQVPSSSDMLLDESRATFALLDKEAQELEATCHQLQMQSSYGRHSTDPTSTLNNRGSVNLPTNPLLMPLVSEFRTASKIPILKAPINPNNSPESPKPPLSVWASAPTMGTLPQTHNVATALHCTADQTEHTLPVLFSQPQTPLSILPSTSSAHPMVMMSRYTQASPIAHPQQPVSMVSSTTLRNTTSQVSTASVVHTSANAATATIQPALSTLSLTSKNLDIVAPVSTISQTTTSILPGSAHTTESPAHSIVRPSTSLTPGASDSHQTTLNVTITHPFTSVQPSSSTHSTLTNHQLQSADILVTEPTSALPAFGVTQPTASTSTLPTTMAQSKPPTVSLDDLWKSSQEKVYFTRDTTSPTSPKHPTTEDKLNVNSQEPHNQGNRKEGDSQEQNGLNKLPKINPLMAVESTTNQEGATVTNQGAAGGDDGMDPVMLKYMELVKQKREQNTTQGDSREVAAAGMEGENSQLDFGIPPLSQASGSYGGFSDKEDDPFDDW